MGKSGSVEQLYQKTLAQYWDLVYSTQAVYDALAILRFYQKLPLEKDNKLILDVGCGTGNASLTFLLNEYEVIGLDYSPHMLEVARKKCARYIRKGKAKFLKGDACSYHFSTKLGLIVSVGGVLNHLASLKDVRRFVESAYRNLRPDGLFIFEFQNRKRLVLDLFAAAETPKHLGLSHHIYHSEEDRTYQKVSGFLKGSGGAYERFSQVIILKPFDVKPVLQICKDVGFRKTYVSSIGDLFRTLANPEKIPDRLFAIAKR